MSREFFISTYEKLSCTILGFILISAIPVAFGLAQNWFIPLASGYQISFFYAAEILIFTFGLLIFPIRLDSSIEKSIFFSLFTILVSRLISLAFATRMELIQIISIGRYFEVGLAIFIVSNMISRKSNFEVFYLGLFFATILETIGGLAKFFISGGTIRGILIGIPSYQIQIFLLLISFYKFIDSKKWYHFLLSTLFISSIVCTETRNAYLQLFLAIILFFFWVCKNKNWKSVLTLTTLLLLYFALFVYGLNRFTEMPKSNRIVQITEGGGTVGWRWYLWDKSLGAFSSSPISGIGSGGFGRQFHNLPQVFNVKIDNIHKDMVLSSHNTVLGILAETGLIGFFAYLFWFYAVVKTINFANGKFNNNIFLVSASIMILVFLISDFWSQNSFYPNFNYFMAIILGHLKSNRV